MSSTRNLDNSNIRSDGESIEARPLADPISFHDRIAEEWDRKYAKASFQSRKLAFERCLPSTELSGTWLDAGCGTGYFARWAADKGAHVESVDLAPRMLELFAHHRGTYHANDRLKEPQIADINRLPHLDASLDGVLCSSVLEYLDDPGSSLREFRRVLRPGGWLAVSVPNRASLLRRGLEAAYKVTGLLGKPWPAYIEFSIHRFTVSEFQQLLRNSGFEVRGFAGCGTSVPGLKNTPLGWSLLVFGAARKP